MDDKAGGEVFSQDKIFAHVDKLNNWLNGDTHTIITAEIDLTNACNSACPQCAGGRASTASLTEEQAFSIINQLADFGVRGVNFTGGGEPTLMSYAKDALKFAHDRGMSVGLITNGIQMDSATIEAIVKYCTWCRISLDAGSQKIYEKVHGVDGMKFAAVIGNIYQLVLAKRKFGGNCTIGTAFLTGRETKDGIIEFVTLSKGLGVDYAQLRPFHNDTTNIEDELRKAKSYEDEHFKVLALSYKYNLFGEEKRPYDKCYAPNFIIVVTSNYELTCCCHTRGVPEFTMGDLNKQSLWEIWNSEKRKKLFDSIDPRKCMPRCRADSTNRILWSIKQLNQKHPKTHENFL